MNSFLLTIHIFAGIVALFTTFITVPFKKGTKLHKTSGRIYFYAMTIVFITALHLSLTPDIKNWFLFSIGIFSYYMAFTGWRAATKRVNLPETIDWIAAGIMIICSGFMYYLASELKNQGNVSFFVLYVFGSIGAALAIQDLIQFRNGPITGKARIIQHLSRMLPSVIAVFTAVLVVNGDKLGIPAMVAWLGPTIVLTPVITLWNILFRLPAVKRKGLGKKLVDQVLTITKIKEN